MPAKIPCIANGFQPVQKSAVLLFLNKTRAMIKVLHNPQCSKSNCALDYLKTRQIAFEIRDYQNNPLDKAELKTLCAQLGLKPEDIVRKTEPVYQEQFAEKHYSDEEWLDILAKNPILIQRPIIIHDGKAVIARPAENIDELL